MGGGGSQPTYVQNDYQETMREALEAQRDILNVFYAEANQEYGDNICKTKSATCPRRSVWTRVNVDDQGYATRFKAGSPEGGTKVEDKWEDYIERNNLLIEVDLIMMALGQSGQQD